MPLQASIFKFVAMHYYAPTGKYIYIRSNALLFPYRQVYLHL
jgi:hypothetical protein